MKHGIIAIDKPQDISSARVVGRVKKALKVKKAGHTGTLDPFATGLMLCGINHGTRISRFLLGGDKVYQAGIRLGVETDTFDITGRIQRTCDAQVIKNICLSDITALTARFKGLQRQLPPVYSALKHNGKPLYKLAREGRPVQKPPRYINIFSLSLINMELPFISMEIHCSAGTYIRTLAHDMGRELGCGACLSSLRRTRSSGFSVGEAVTLSDLEKTGTEKALSRLIPMADALGWMPKIIAGPELIQKIRFGRELFRKDISLPLGDRQPDNLVGFPESPCLSNKPPGYFIQILEQAGDLAAIIEYDNLLDKYKYCCVFIT